MSSSTTTRNAYSRNGPNGSQAGTLLKAERWWRDRYNDIAERGYRLRPRYNPQWEPSWFKTGKDFLTAEGGQATILSAAMDATHIQDGRLVMLKKVLSHEKPHELRINELFSSAAHAINGDNHCAPLLDVIELSRRFGSQKLMVFPLLRPFNQLRIQTFGEFAAFITQICEGIRFMHQRNVAHRDCTANNIMFDPSTMTRRLPRYYFIGFGMSRQYPSRDAMDESLRGGDKSAPEHRLGLGQLCNPFHTDIYYVGDLVRQEFMEKCNGFEFMEDLVASMTQDNPASRPSIEDVLQEFSHIRESLDERKLRSAIISKNTPKVFGIILQARQSVRTLGSIVSCQPAIPDSYT